MCRFDANGKPLACPNGVGLPGASATLPTAPIFYDATKLQTLATRAPIRTSWS
jgi:hypothetical protein